MISSRWKEKEKRWTSKKFS